MRHGPRTRRPTNWSLFGAGLLATIALVSVTSSSTAFQTDLHVPSEYPTIQMAVDAAPDGATVVVAPGTYTENITVGDKAVAIRSEHPADLSRVADTVINGAGGAHVVFFASGSDGSSISGVTLTDASDGIRAEASVDVHTVRVHDTGDGIDYQRDVGGMPTGGSVTNSIIEANGDDGIDLDNTVDVTITDNIIRGNDDGGIEVRFDDYQGPVVMVRIERNTIVGNGENGIQLIDVDEVTDRVVRIERNVIADNTAVGIGSMPNGITQEAFTGADLEELVIILNNTVTGNRMGITGGDRMAIVNNLVALNTEVGIKRVAGASELSNNLVWNNGTDFDGVTAPVAATVMADPRLDESYRPSPAGPAIDAGVSSFEYESVDVFETPPPQSGDAPDVGAFEFDWLVDARFIDVPMGHRFFDEVQWIAFNAITLGCDAAGENFCPDHTVTRGQMAAFLVRSLGLTDDGNQDWFTDDDNSTFESEINRLAHAGITLGCDATGENFCPEQTVTRGQMAAFLERSFNR